MAVKTYKTDTPRITLAMLRGACKEQRDIFEAEWPEGVDVTIENVRRAQELGLTLAWGEHWFTAPARKAYDAARDTAEEAYDAARVPARKVYYAATAPARKAYIEATAQGRKAYDAATAQAWKVYYAATAPAWVAYHEATATAWKTYLEATATAWKAYREAITQAWVAAYIASVAEREAQPSKAS